MVDLKSIFEKGKECGPFDKIPGPGRPGGGDNVIIGEAQLILAEKRTSFSAIRTGIAVLALPLSVFSLLIATSKFYNVLHVLYLAIPLIAVNAGLMGLGVYLITRAMVRIRRFDRLLHQLKCKHSKLAEFLE